MNDRVANSIRSLDAQRANRDLSYFPALNYFRAVNDITDQTFSCVFRQINMLYPAAKFFREKLAFSNNLAVRVQFFSQRYYLQSRFLVVLSDNPSVFVVNLSSTS